MYSRHRLGLNNYTIDNVSMKEALLNSHKTSEIVKSELQLNKMTNLLKVINT